MVARLPIVVNLVRLFLSTFCTIRWVVLLIFSRIANLVMMRFLRRRKLGKVSIATIAILQQPRRMFQKVVNNVVLLERLEVQSADWASESFPEVPRYKSLRSFLIEPKVLFSLLYIQGGLIIRA